MMGEVDQSLLEQHVRQFRDPETGAVKLVDLYCWLYGESELDKNALQYLEDITSLHPVASRQVAAVAVATARHAVKTHDVTLEHRAGLVERVLVKLRILPWPS